MNEELKYGNLVALHKTRDKDKIIEAQKLGYILDAEGSKFILLRHHTFEVITDDE